MENAGYPTKPTAKDVAMTRKEAGLSIEEASLLMNVSYSTWWSWENGRNRMSMSMMDRFKEVVSER